MTNNTAGHEIHKTRIQCLTLKLLSANPQWQDRYSPWFDTGYYPSHRKK